MVGIAIASLGLIGAGAYQGLTASPPLSGGIDQGIVAWLCSLGGVLVLALLTRSIIKKMVNKTQL